MEAFARDFPNSPQCKHDQRTVVDLGYEDTTTKMENSCLEFFKLFEPAQAEYQLSEKTAPKSLLDLKAPSCVGYSPTMRMCGDEDPSPRKKLSSTVPADRKDCQTFLTHRQCALNFKHVETVAFLTADADHGILFYTLCIMYCYCLCFSKQSFHKHVMQIDRNQECGVMH